MILSAAGAECAAHGNLSLSGRGADQEKVGYIDAGNKPKNRCRRHERDEPFFQVGIYQRIDVAVNDDTVLGFTKVGIHITFRDLCLQCSQVSFRRG